MLWISFWIQKLIHNVSFWIQKLMLNVSFWTKKIWIQKLLLWISFWTQKLTKNISFWIQKLTFFVSFFSGSRNWHYGSVSGSRNWHYGRGELYVILWRLVTSLMGPPGASILHYSTVDSTTLVYLVIMIFFLWEDIPAQQQSYSRVESSTTLNRVQCKYCNDIDRFHPKPITISTLRHHHHRH